MARQIVVLETRKGGDGLTSVNGVMWFPIVAAAARLPRAGYVSGLNQLTSPSLTAQEQAALEDGSVREEPFAVSYPSTVTLAQVKSDLVSRYAARASAIAAEPAIRQFYGLTFDGTTWA
jgi:hypothetical protein